MHLPTLVHARAGVLTPLVSNNGILCSVRLFRLVVCRERLSQLLRRFFSFRVFTYSQSLGHDDTSLDALGPAGAAPEEVGE
jgi:hypothetical protein